MKKLLTIFTAAGLLVAGGSSALALEGANNGSGTEFNPFENGELAPAVDKEIRDQLAEKSAQRTADKNGGVWVEVDGVKKFIPAKKATQKAPAKKVVKVLPKTSAVK